ncbi:glutamate--cysteine ligase [Nitrosomonas sp. JL21]|uniref:glutamate--cysteine ligase n=1 Tax=Nitrosomonas sp. JL21 TaxID=153949 RepID=UPI00136BEE43|nr:glutamate--cysteine ligase [Nitrosomonas sp. JL21]MBL8498835.1 glutamate--cysteine ligase [Nitrosomonas sp.]MCC7092393.1 glutamate--cysteine ligase [Nitrosomonas sp.]MXS77997.1 glutamate--cysteine ligase [Nitrosomonas sp. JL21]
MPVPHLSTALRGPILDLENRIITAMPSIEHWLRSKWREHTVPFYCSVDLRNSGFKLAPVDTNLFPGGFNNLNPEFMPLCVQAMMNAIEKICPDTQSVLLVPENHTRNTFYLQNIATLQSIMQQAGLNVRIGSLLPEITAATTIDLPDGQAITLEPLIRKNNQLGVKNFEPCAVILNNDLSTGIPDILQNLSQAIIPPLHAGWATRRKSVHFSAYDQVAQEFAELIGIDPWLINPRFTSCGEINFREKQGEDCVASAVNRIIAVIQKKYQEYGVKEDPFVIVKADSGTYGMGIMTVKDGADIYKLNRKQRNKMAVVKEGMQVSNVLVQEGVYTFENINQAVAEPVIYMIDRYVVGGFYRVHTGRGIDENLNAPGMHFVPLAFEASCLLPKNSAQTHSIPNRFYAYGVVARLALLAAALELEQEQAGLNTPAPLPAD